MDMILILLKAELRRAGLKEEANDAKFMNKIASGILLRDTPRKNGEELSPEDQHKAMRASIFLALVRAGFTKEARDEEFIENIIQGKDENKEYDSI